MKKIVFVCDMCGQGEGEEYGALGPSIEEVSPLEMCEACYTAVESQNKPVTVLLLVQTAFARGARRLSVPRYTRPVSYGTSLTCSPGDGAYDG